MKKIFYILASAIVALGAVACENDAMDNIANTEGDTVSFVANIDDTKTDLLDKQTIWDDDDTIVINWNDGTKDRVSFFKNSGNSVFTCTEDGLNAIKEADIIASYSNKNDGAIDSEADTAGAWLYYKGTFADLESGKKCFEVQNAFLKFTATEGVVVTLTASAEIFSTSTELTLTATGEAQYVAVLPATTTITYAIGGETIKTSKENTLEAKKIYDLGELAMEKSAYSVVGSFQGWATDVNNAIPMYSIADGWVVAKGVELYKSDEFKIVKDNSWDVSYGLASAGVLATDTEVDVVTKNSQNMKAAKNGKFDIYFNGSNKVRYVCVEEYTDLTVNITIDNKANWSPLYITLKSGENVVVENATVTGNVFAVSGDYIGESLSYTLSNGTKTSEGNVTIAKDGATINLEETIIKLKVQLNTDNAKQWWGNTMKIHVWNTGTSFDTSWPGTTMTNEGNYTWSINVPSELVGKTINYLVHNGGGWQSSNATVTIKKEGNTVTSSSIGID